MRYPTSLPQPSVHTITAVPQITRRPALQLTGLCEASYMRQGCNYLIFILVYNVKIFSHNFVISLYMKRLSDCPVGYRLKWVPDISLTAYVQFLSKCYSFTWYPPISSSVRTSWTTWCELSIFCQWFFNGELYKTFLYPLPHIRPWSYLKHGHKFFYVAAYIGRCYMRYRCTHITCNRVSCPAFSI